jgi:thiol-disulfide isomerase/thioredoxin
MRAAQVGNPDMAVVHGRERALEILRQHYLAHEDLDWPLMSLLGGPVPFGAEDVLKTIAEKSPHEHVRAAALFIWAALLKHHADIITSRKGLPPAKAPESALDKLALEQDRKMLERLLKLHDEKQARKEAERLAKQVLNEYPKVAVPVRAAGPEGPYMPRRYKAPIKVKIPTYAEQAEALLFDLTQLAVGQATPPIVGRDSEGKEFRLTDCKGKVVVLMFSANWCAPCKGLYPTLRDLQKKFDGKPLVVVTVMADSELKTVRQAIDKGDMTWQAVWDGEAGPIASKWNVTRFPTLYVFDQRGIIRSRNATDGRELETIVAGLLKEEK